MTYVHNKLQLFEKHRRDVCSESILLKKAKMVLIINQFVFNYFRLVMNQLPLFVLKEIKFFASMNFDTFCCLFYLFTKIKLLCRKMSWQFQEAKTLLRVNPTKRFFLENR